MSHLLHGAYDPANPDRRTGPFVILEGISGIGKSTLAAVLHQAIGGLQLHTVPPPLQGWCPQINAQLRALPQFGFYLSGLLHASDIIRAALPHGPVIADRYVSSVHAYHAAVHRLDLDQVDHLLEPFRPYLLAPDLTVYLHCTEATLRERMNAKTDLNEDDAQMLNVPGRLARLLKNFDVMAAADPTAIHLHTDHQTPAELAHRILSALHDRFGWNPSEPATGRPGEDYAPAL